VERALVVAKEVYPAPGQKAPVVGVRFGQLSDDGYYITKPDGSRVYLVWDRSVWIVRAPASRFLSREKQASCMPT